MFGVAQRYRTGLPMQETRVRSLVQEDPLEEEINDNSLQYSCLGNPMNRGAWRATVHGVAKESDIIEQLNNNNNMSSVGHSHPVEKVILHCIIILF